MTDNEEETSTTLSTLGIEWVTGLKALVPLTGTLVAFASGPREFILDVVVGYILEVVVAGVLDAALAVMGAIGAVWEPLLIIPATAAGPFLDAGGAVASALAGVLLTVQGILVSVATAAGPFAPVVVVAFWAVIGVAAARAIVLLLQATPYVGQWI